jgi:hypothetical protein
LKVLEQHLKGGSPDFAVEYRIRHNDGGWRWVLTRGIALVSPEGVAYRMAGSQTDISAFKRLEEDLKTARAEAEQAKRGFHGTWDVVPLRSVGSTDNRFSEPSTPATVPHPRPKWRS